MLPNKNRTISVSRLTTVGEKRIFSVVITGLGVYINQSQEDELPGYENQPGFFIHKMLTEGNHIAINMGDRIIDDGGKSYDIRGKTVHSSLIGTHHQYLLTEATN